MGNDGEALLRLWREKRGEADPPDYCETLVVQLGPQNSSLAAGTRKLLDR